MLPEARWFSEGHAAAGAVQICMTYAATRCHCDVPARLLPRTMSGSMTLQWPESELMSVDPVTTEG